MRRRAGEEDLIGDEQLRPVDRAFDDFEAEFLTREREHGVERDAFEYVVASARGDQAAVAHHHEVLAGTLGHVAVIVEHDRFVEAVLECLGLRQRRIHVEAVDLGARGD